MRIRVQKLGTIKKAEVDLRPLTVIIGPNNSSKTYLAYAIYGLMKQNVGNAFLDVVSDLATTSSDGNSCSFTLTQPILDEITAKTSASFRTKLTTFFQDTDGNLFQNTQIGMHIPLAGLVSKIQQQIEEFPRRKLGEIEYTVGIEDTTITACVTQASTPGRSGRESAEEDQARERRFWPVMWVLCVEGYLRYVGSVTLFPAERNAFITTYKLLSNRRFRQLRDANREQLSSIQNLKHLFKDPLNRLNESDDIRYPQPIEDFLDMLADIELGVGIYRSEEEKHLFSALATEIETRIQQKNSLTFKPTPLGGKEIKVKVKPGLQLDLYNASSSIKQLAPILLYLRHRAKKNDFIIIDEPEMNLHPETQARFLEALAMMVNAGIRVLATTHSPYIMSHLNNLVAGATDKPETLAKQAEQLYLRDTRAFLTQEQVSAYEMRDRTLVSLKDPDYGIRWDTLSDVSSDIQQKFFAISALDSHE